METIGAGNIFSDMGADMSGEQYLQLATAAGVRIERIVSTGQTTPEGQWYDQDWTEWVLLVKGRAILHIEGEVSPRDLRPGDWLELKPNVRHRVNYTDGDAPTVWLAVHVGEKSGGAPTAD